jgi:hypothetical protein
VSGHPNQAIRKRQGALRIAISKRASAESEYSMAGCKEPEDREYLHEKLESAKRAVDDRIDELTSKAYSFGLDVVFNNRYNVDEIYKNLEPMARMRTTRENIVDVIAALKAMAS